MSHKIMVFKRDDLLVNIKGCLNAIENGIKKKKLIPLSGGGIDFSGDFSSIFDIFNLLDSRARTVILCIGVHNVLSIVHYCHNGFALKKKLSFASQILKCPPTTSSV